jgi:MYXO-CTERM domain-containing protein
MNWSAPHALEVLFSPAHGFFVWTPLALLGLAGLVWWCRRNRQVGICLLVMVAFQIYVGGSVESWTVAGAFGQRRFIALTTVLVIGCAAASEALRGSTLARRLFTSVTVLAVYWNLALIAEFSVGLMDRQRLEPRKNVYDAFVTLPGMAPSLAYRYLFDRGSFYKHGP